MSGRDAIPQYGNEKSLGAVKGRWAAMRTGVDRHDSKAILAARRAISVRVPTTLPYPETNHSFCAL